MKCIIGLRCFSSCLSYVTWGGFTVVWILNIQCTFPSQMQRFYCGLSPEYNVFSCVTWGDFTVVWVLNIECEHFALYAITPHNVKGYCLEYPNLDTFML